MNFGLPPEQITREIFFNVGGPHGFMRWGIYLFFLISISFLIYTIVKKMKKWHQGKPEARNDQIFKRFWLVIKYIMLQSKILKERYAGIMHATIFFGFIVLVIVTIIILVQEDFTIPVFKYKFIHGNFYIIWSLFGDVFGAVVLLGLLMAFYRRYISKPSRLDTQKTDTMALLLLTFIVITGFFNESMRIAMTNFPPFEKYASPVGYALAIPFSIFSNKVLGTAHYINWWVHMLTAFLFIGLLATEKLGHIVISSMNIFYGNLDNEKAETKYTMPLIDPAEFETAETFGVNKIEEYTWKQLMDSDACTRCGRCQDNCPAWLTEKPLSPKKLVIDIKDNMDERIPKIKNLEKSEDKEKVESKALIGDSVQPEEFWACTNCGACMEACPVNIEHVPKMLDMRRHKVLMEGDMAPELQNSFTNLENNFNPYGFAFAERGAWAEELELKTIAEDKEVDYLYFVGSAASFDKRNQQIATTFVKIMQKAGYKIGILGAEELDSGEAALRAGNEYLFQMMAAQNLETFKNYDIKKIVCTCPHDYNTLKKEYKAFAKVGKTEDGKDIEYNFKVYHSNEILIDLIKEGKINLTEKIEETVTYHDSCILGRYNNMYTAPREILHSVPGVKLVEMPRHKETSFCCGAGGARMFIDEKLGTRINQFRTKEAQLTGAQTICTACPFCMTMLSDGLTELNIENMKTLDLVEIVYSAMSK